MGDGDADLTRTEAAVLGLVAWSGGGSGYDLAGLTQTSVGYVWAPTRSQFYVVLPRLARHGLVTSEAVPQEGRPDKVHHTVTPAGRRALGAWIARDERPEPEDRDGMLLKLFFAEHGPAGTVSAQLEGYAERVAARLREYRALERRLVDAREQPGALAALRLGIALMQATSDWAEATVASRPWRTTVDA